MLTFTCNNMFHITIMIKFIPMILLFCVLFSAFTNGFEVDDISLTKEEQLQVDKQFHSLNKPAIRTVQMKNGDLYDCVDFYKQPGFDHPSLKNHTFHPQMRPSLAGTKTRPSNDREIKPMRVDCPFGTVPIRRLTKDDLLRAKLYEKRYNSRQDVPENQDNAGSSVRTRNAIAMLGEFGESSGIKFMGAGSVIAPFNISVGRDQRSLSHMRLIRQIDSIEVGFMVNPSMYNGAGDVHFYIRTKTNEINCYNVMCPGFILVNPYLSIDPIVSPVSRIGGPTYTSSFFIQRDMNNGNWLLKLGESREQVGFWPSNIFGGEGLGGGATMIDWGGEVFSPVGVPPPPMGAGMDILKSKSTAFCGHLIKINEAGQEGDVTENLEEYVTKDSAYRVIDKGMDPYYKRVVAFGGQGGAS